MNILLFDSLCPSSPPLASCLPNKSPSNSDHVVIIIFFSRFVTTGLHSTTRMPLDWAGWNFRSGVMCLSAVGPRLGNSWEMSVVSGLVKPWIFPANMTLGLVLQKSSSSSSFCRFMGSYLSISVALSQAKENILKQSPLCSSWHPRPTQSDVLTLYPRTPHIFPPA